MTLHSVSSCTQSTAASSYMFENFDFPLPSLFSMINSTLHDAVGMPVWQMTLCMSPLGSSIHVSMQALYYE